MQESTLFKGGQRGAPVAPEETISKALIFHPRQRGGRGFEIWIPLLLVLDTYFEGVLEGCSDPDFWGSKSSNSAQSGFLRYPAHLGALEQGLS